MKFLSTLRRSHRSQKIDESPLLPQHLDALETRRSDAVAILGSGANASHRVTSAPAAYTLAHAPSDIARHCGLLDPIARIGEVRVVVTPSRTTNHWNIDITALDRPGLLAAFTGVFEDYGLDVTQAVVATWNDGAALQAFTVKSQSPPDPTVLQSHLERSLDQPLRAEPAPQVHLRFDHDASVLFTRCEVRAEDRVGLLHALAVAFSAAGTDVHGASVSTHDGVALDSFDLSEGGGKLSLETEALIERIIRDGVGMSDVSSRRSFGRPRSRSVADDQLAVG
jgi:UTP:GlnB (protein PII) uridylyltransferase